MIPATSDLLHSSPASVALVNSSVVFVLCCVVLCCVSSAGVGRGDSLHPTPLYYNWPVEWLRPGRGAAAPAGPPRLLRTKLPDLGKLGLSLLDIDICVFWQVGMETGLAQHHHDVCGVPGRHCSRHWLYQHCTTAALLAGDIRVALAHCRFLQSAQYSLAEPGSWDWWITREPQQTSHSGSRHHTSRQQLAASRHLTQKA